VTEREWRLVVLGIAQDGGVPHMGCEKGPCAAARRGERRAEKVACLGLTDGERAYVFDATPDLPAQVHAMGARAPSGVFLTHAHIGHYTGLVHLGKEVLGARGVPVYATPKMTQFLSTNAPWSALVANGNVEFRDNADVDLGDVRVTAFQVPHRNEYADTVGYLIEGPRAKAVFIPDIDRWVSERPQADERTGTVPDARTGAGLAGGEFGSAPDKPFDIRALVSSVDHAFLDATFSSGDELPGRDMSKVPHPLVPDTMTRLDGLGARVRFIHLNHTNPLLDDPSPAERRGFRVAREGDVFDL
jgi:pyrroloquinoline quinone biosynthesis protein B